MYSDTGIYSCVGVERGGQPIATTVANLYARGRKFDLDVFGGIIFTCKHHDDINTVADLKDKIIASQVISDFAGAQAQFYVMQQNGLDYIMDPKQVIFYGTLTLLLLVLKEHSLPLLKLTCIWFYAPHRLRHLPTSFQTTTT